MEILFEIIGEVLLGVLQWIWPPVLAIVNGAMVLYLAFLGWVFFTEGELAKAIISLLAAGVFLAVGITGFKTGLYTRKGRNDRCRKK